MVAFVIPVARIREALERPRATLMGASGFGEFERRMRAGEPVNLGENGNQRREQPFERPATPGATVLYHSDAPGEPLLPALVVATPESRGQGEALDWFPDFAGTDELEEPVHLAVLNPDPGTPVFFVPRVGRGDKAGEWRWP